MTTTLTYLSNVLALPVGLQWSDEFRWSAVEQRKRYSITGALHVSASTKQAGRPITLASGAWLTRAMLDTLNTWRGLPAQTFTLVLRGEPARTVVFDHEAGGIEATRVGDEFEDVAAGDYYRATLRFIEV